MINYEDISTLSDVELLKIVIRENSEGNTAHRLIEEFIDIKGCLVDAEIEELQKIKGLGYRRITQIKAVYELCKRLYNHSAVTNPTITSPADIADIMIPRMQFLRQEQFDVILLNTKNRVIDIKTLFIGTYDSALVDPKIVFNYAIRKGAKSLVLCHNHPSSDPSPSKEDIHLTKRLVDCGKMLNIEILDHIVIGGNRYLSFKEKSLL